MKSPTDKKWPLLVILLAFSFSVIADETLPTAQDINDAAQKAKQTYDSFFEQTFTIRMQYEYSGRFLNPGDKDTLCKASQKASAELEQIANTQTTMKKTIEAYQKDDWETLFGQTGLWRKLAADLADTQTAKQEIDYNLERFKGDIKINQQFFNTLAKFSFSPCAPIRASLEKIKHLGQSEPNELDNIADSLAKGDCKENTEIILTLAILQNKYVPDKPQEALFLSAQASELFGKIILADISAGADINTLNPFTAVLCAVWALQTNPSAHKELLLSIASTEKLKTPSTLYLAATSLFETDPSKAVKLLIESNKLQYQQQVRLMDTSPETAARVTAEYAYDYFIQNKIDCNLALAAFDNYKMIASDKLTEEMRYHYGSLLLYCGKKQEASEFFTKLFGSSESIWRDKATLEILKIKIKEGYSNEDHDYKETLSKLRNFILNCKGQDEHKWRLRLEVMDLYCRTVLAHDNNDSATEVLNLLDTTEQTPGLRYALFKAQALYQLGRLEESARYMSKAIAEDSNSSAVLAAQIASDIVDKIELWQKDANDSNKLLKNCNTLAEFTNKSERTSQTALLLAEVLLLEGKTIDYPLPSNNEDVIWLRVQARVLMQQEKFDQSAKLWSKIAESKRNETAGQNNKNYNWWQAKYYELDCLAKSPQANKQNIAHAIDVLIGTYPQIASPWAEKLDLLKKQCAAN